MKKIILTRQDIQRDLILQLNKLKGAAVFLTVIIIIAVLPYPLHLISYFYGTPFDYTKGISLSLTPAAALIITPLLTVFLIIAVFYIHYIDLYNIKKGRFVITEDSVYHKEKEWQHHYRNSQKENFLYFRCGKIRVEDNVYSCSCVGDRFYIVTVRSLLRSKCSSRLAYHTKFYKTDSPQ